MNERTVTPTGKPRSRERTRIDTDQFAAFTRRVITAYARRVADADIEALTGLADLAADVDSAIRHAVDGLRRCGFTWAEIAQRLHTTRAGAQRWTYPTTTRPATADVPLFELDPPVPQAPQSGCADLIGESR